MKCLDVQEKVKVVQEMVYVASVPRYVPVMSTGKEMAAMFGTALV